MRRGRAGPPPAPSGSTGAQTTRTVVRRVRGLVHGAVRGRCRSAQARHRPLSCTCLRRRQRRSRRRRHTAMLARGLCLVNPRTVRPTPLRSMARGHSSAGRAPALQAGGRRFEPGWLHYRVPATPSLRHGSARRRPTARTLSTPCRGAAGDRSVGELLADWDAAKRVCLRAQRNRHSGERGSCR